MKNLRMTFKHPARLDFLERGKKGAAIRNMEAKWAQSNNVAYLSYVRGCPDDIARAFVLVSSSLSRIMRGVHGFIATGKAAHQGFECRSFIQDRNTVSRSCRQSDIFGSVNLLSPLDMRLSGDNCVASSEAAGCSI